MSTIRLTVSFACFRARRDARRSALPRASRSCRAVFIGPWNLLRQPGIGGCVDRAAFACACCLLQNPTCPAGRVQRGDREHRLPDFFFFDFFRLQNPTCPAGRVQKGDRGHCLPDFSLFSWKRTLFFEGSFFCSRARRRSALCSLSDSSCCFTARCAAALRLSVRAAFSAAAALSGVTRLRARSSSS